MNYAVLYNAFVCLLVAFFSLTAGRALLVHDDPSGAARLLGWSWICGALLWLFTGVRLTEYFLFLRTGNDFHEQADRFFYYLNEIALAGQVACGAAFAARLALRVGVARLAVGLTGVSAAAFLSLLFGYGIEATIQTPWASRQAMPGVAFLAFLPGYGLSIFLMGYAIIFMARKRRTGGDERARWALPALLAFLLYGLVGGVDVRGVSAGWQLLLIRTAYLAAALTTYWVAQPADASMQVVRRRRNK